MKKTGLWMLTLIMILMIVLPSTGHAAITESTHINLDGQELALPASGQVETVNGTVMVPLRVIVEQLGYKVTWSNRTQTATIKQNKTTLQLAAGSHTATVDDKAIDLPEAPLLQNGTTLVPLRFISENTGTSVKWDNTAKTVYLTNPKKVVTPAKGDTTDTTPPADTTDQSALQAISFSDSRLTVTLNGTASPKYSALTNPNRIVLDLPKTAFSESFLNGKVMNLGNVGKVDVAGDPDVAGIRYSLFSNQPSTVRVVMDLNNAQKYKVINNNKGVVIVELDGAVKPASTITNGNGTANNGNTQVSGNPNTSTDPVVVTNPDDSPSTDPNSDPTTTPTDTPSKAVPVTPSSGPGKDGKKLVVIDAGHGGKDSGAISITGKYEKNFTLPVVLKIQALLEQEPNIDFVLTRSDDSYPTLPDRVKVANDLNADVFVSIHGNSTTSAVSPSGTEMYYSRSSSLTLAQIVHKHVVAALGLSDRGIHQKSLHVTRETTMPAILIEAGYLSNPTDEALMYTDAFQQQLAEAVVAGIKEYLGVS